MSQMVTEEARRGWLNGASYSPLAGPFGTLADRPPPASPVYFMVLRQPAITSASAVPITPALMILNAACISPLRQLLLLQQDAWLPQSP